MAQSKTYRETVSVIGKIKLGETDLILTLLTRDGYQIQAVAKGARKPKSRLSHAAQLFTTLDAWFARGRNLDILTEARIIENPSYSSSVELLSAASALAEITRKLSIPEQPNPYLFGAYETALATLVDTLEPSQIDELLSAFIFKVCAKEGWRPELIRCIGCSQEIDTTGGPRYFSLSEGGVFCAKCADERTEDVSEISTQYLGYMRSLLYKRFSELMEGQPPEKEMTRHVLYTAFAWLENCTTGRLKACEFYLSV